MIAEIKKICPICGDEFVNKRAKTRKESTTCSYSCANIYFRSGKNHPSWKGYDLKGSAKYRRICFDNHEHKCVICGEHNLVEVHHLDGNHENNVPENLIPLCSTHHQYWHSKFKNLIEPAILKYIGEWKLNDEKIDKG